MVKRVFIVHGWASSPGKDFHPWLKSKLEEAGFEVFAPEMPDTDNPRIETWVPFLAKQVGKLDKDTYFVGHSIGCQTILRFLERAKGKAGGCVFVGGWFSLRGLETTEEKEIAAPWLETSIDFEKVKKATKKFAAIFSDNDPYVPMKNVDFVKENLGARVVIEKGLGHFTEEEGVTELPVALKELLKLIK